ncbi:hypothetical protein [Micromonospora sp. NBC_01796]|uniref:hypothetical protein n=1 Tax=Micromonospora sp. NBC_01796 TaxID=2975987 RepID=UPI002DDB6C52|nr:hypothetical protein [Micromonospora sp. NBC_01796]WSA88091.1 hypothetical protein OIE47_11030 [Micromonospora sp. NBC_01796]
MSARQDDGFRQALRKLATKRPVDFRHDAILHAPEREWYRPKNAREVAVQHAVRSARAQGLPDKVQDQSLISRAAALFQGGASRG